jgi:hypothetical protein
MSFGKRPSSAALQPAEGPHSQPGPPSTGDHSDQRQVPHAPAGSAGDHITAAPSAASINAALQEGKSRLEERLASATATARPALPDAQLRPFLLIPDTIWASELGTFLMSSLALFPYDDWNVVFLAADQATATAMDIALHPNGEAPTFVSAAEKLLDEVRAHMKRAGDEVEVTADYAAFQNIREDAQLRVKGLAMAFARTLIEAWERQKDERGAMHS